MAIPETDLSNSEFNRFREIVDSANKNFKERVQRSNQLSQQGTPSLRSGTPKIGHEPRARSSGSMERFPRRMGLEENLPYADEQHRQNRVNLTLDHGSQMDTVPKWYLSRRTTEGIKSKVEYTAERQNSKGNQRSGHHYISNIKGSHLLNEPSQKPTSYSVWELSKRLGVNSRFSKSSLQVDDTNAIKLTAKPVQSVSKNVGISTINRDLIDSPLKRELFKTTDDKQESWFTFKNASQKTPSVFDPQSRVVVNLKLSQANQKATAKQPLMKSATSVSGQNLGLGGSPKLQANLVATGKPKNPISVAGQSAYPLAFVPIIPSPQLSVPKAVVNPIKKSESPGISMQYVRQQTPHHPRESIDSIIRQKTSINPDHLKKLSDLEEFMALQTLQRKGIYMASGQKNLSKDNSRVETLPASKPDTNLPSSTTKTREISSLLRTCTKESQTISNIEKIQKMIKHSVQAAPSLAAQQPSPLLANAIKACKMNMANCAVKPNAASSPAGLAPTQDPGAGSYSKSENTATRIASLLGVGKHSVGGVLPNKPSSANGLFRPPVQYPASTAPHTPTLSAGTYNHHLEHQLSSKPFSALVKSRGSISRGSDTAQMPAPAVSALSAHKAGLFLIRGASATSQGMANRL